ncbi:MAG: AMP nucleosidase [Parvularculaceae bacterium]
MATDPERITILAREFTAAALEFHRGRMAEKGYRMEGSITPRAFKMIEGVEPPKDLFDAEPLFAVTFVKRDSIA